MSAAACIGFDSSPESPLKRRRIDDETTLSIRPTGFVAASYTPEVEALELPLEATEAGPEHHTCNRAAVNTD